MSICCPPIFGLQATLQKDLHTITPLYRKDTVISLGTIAGIGRAAGVDLDRRRFRANIVLETQQVRLYARQGFVLRAVNKLAYGEFPNEVQLLWYKDLYDNLPSG